MLGFDSQVPIYGIIGNWESAKATFRKPDFSGPIRSRCGATLLDIHSLARMNDSTSKQMAEAFVRGLDRRLRRAIVKAGELAIRQGIAVSLDIFFAALLRTSGKEFCKHFSNADALTIPEIKAEGTRKLSASDFYFVGFDPQVSELLWDAIRISRAMNKKSAGLDELVAAFCLKDEMVLGFEAAKGVVPKKFVKRLSSPPTSE
jgi:hypothetical protein